MTKISKTAKKRLVKISGKGKLLRRRQSAQHLAGKKSKRSRRGAAKKIGFSKPDRKKLKKILGI